MQEGGGFMEPSCAESFSGGQRRNRAIMEELLRGRDSTNQLQILLGMPLLGYASAPGTASPEDLVLKILRSFTEALGILNCSGGGGGGGESEEVVSQAPKRYNSTPCSDGSRRSEEESGDSCKSSTAAFKDRRGSYKRRKTTHSWTKTIPTLVDDGHAWRKYGQKVILNAKYPRNYYRCTHKFDQGCQATKQVQRTEGEPAMYQITYNGHHICRKAPLPHLIFNEVDPASAAVAAITADGDSSPNSILLSFEYNPNARHHNYNHPFFASSFPSSSPTIKQEYYGVNNTTTTTQSPPSDHHQYLLSPLPDLTAYESSVGGGHLTFLSSSDQADSSTHSLDMDVMVGSVDFSDDVLQFDF
uniref:WRKY transcription factor 9 n=1 Tax=Santalum album TaxID=35974 RepID=A0A650C2S1_SANAL|nr:WRKY transcription factor 9 [Santalum album]